MDTPCINRKEGGGKERGGDESGNESGSKRSDISRRFVLGVAYHGANYFGWQSQQSPKLPTVQDSLEKALSKVANTPIQVVCAGRTDKGVHASGQVIHFDTPVLRSLHAWVYGTNSYLPNDVSVQWAKLAPADFHARFSAIERHYRYTVYNHPIPSPLSRDLMTWVSRPLNVEAMREAAGYLCGEHDFSSFRASQCQSKTAVRNLRLLEVSSSVDDKSCIYFDVYANAFLHHMVRNIVGLLIVIGQGKQLPIWASQVLAARDRRVAPPTAPPNGLCLVGVRYLSAPDIS